MVKNRFSIKRLESSRGLIEKRKRVAFFEKFRSARPQKSFLVTLGAWQRGAFTRRLGGGNRRSRARKLYSKIQLQTVSQGDIAYWVLRMPNATETEKGGRGAREKTCGSIDLIFSRLSNAVSIIFKFFPKHRSKVNHAPTRFEETLMKFTSTWMKHKLPGSKLDLKPR